MRTSGSTIGTMSAAEAARWRSWADDHRGALVDSVADDDDPRPLFADAARQVYDCVRHPRAFLLNVALDR